MLPINVISLPLATPPVRRDFGAQVRQLRHHIYPRYYTSLASAAPCRVVYIIDTSPRSVNNTSLRSFRRRACPPGRPALPCTTPIRSPSHRCQKNRTRTSPPSLVARWSDVVPAPPPPSLVARWSDVVAVVSKIRASGRGPSHHGARGRRHAEQLDDTPGAQRRATPKP